MPSIDVNKSKHDAEWFKHLELKKLIKKVEPPPTVPEKPKKVKKRRNNRAKAYKTAKGDEEAKDQTAVEEALPGTGAVTPRD